MFDRILVIEDNEQDQKIITRYLRKAGAVEIFIAASGEEGTLPNRRCAYG